MSGMTLEEAYDEYSVCSPEEAMREIQNHGFDCYEAANSILAYGQGIIFPDIVAEVVDGEVSTKKVLEWLGY